MRQRKPEGISVAEKTRAWNSIEQGLAPQASFVSYTAFWKRTQVKFAAIFFGLLVLSGGAATAYADNAKPGDLLFPVLVAQEKAQILFTADKAIKEDLRIKFAEKRLSEIRALTALVDDTSENDQEGHAPTLAGTSSTNFAEATDSTSLESEKRALRARRGTEVALKELEKTRALFERDGREQSRHAVDDIITEVHAVSLRGGRNKGRDEVKSERDTSGGKHQNGEEDATSTSGVENADDADASVLENGGSRKEVKEESDDTESVSDEDAGGDDATDDSEDD